MLVDYTSDSDDEKSPKETSIAAVKEEKLRIDSTKRPTPKANGFTRLARPKKPSRDTGFTLPNPLQTTIKDIEEDDEDEIERPATKRARLNGPSTSSLFSSLSAPKNTGPLPTATSRSNLSLLPPSVISKAPPKPTSAPPSEAKTVERNEEKDDAVSFFGLGPTLGPSKGPTIGPASRPTTANPIKINPSIYTSTVPETNLIHNPDGTSYYHDGPVDEVALQKQYSDYVPASANVIDVPDPRDRTLEPERPAIIYDTSESDKIAAQNGDYKPSAVAKYKHTLGSLIHEARAKHAEYQERFAANRRAKREAGARYGF